jgi:hypothetical protein
MGEGRGRGLSGRASLSLALPRTHRTALVSLHRQALASSLAHLSGAHSYAGGDSRSGGSRPFAPSTS